MARIGDYINPQLGAINYDRFAATSAAAAAQQGDAIARGISAIGSIIEDRQKKKEDIAASDALIAALATYGGDNTGALSDMRAALADPGRSLGDRASVARVSPALISAYMQTEEANKGRAADERRMGLDEKKFNEIVRQFDLGRSDATGAALAKQTAEQQAASLRAAGRFLVNQEENAAAGIQPLPGSNEFLSSLIKQGQGEAALSVMDALDAASGRQREAAKPPTLKPIKLGGTGPDGQPVEIDAFTSPDGRVFDINRRPINGGEAWGDGSGGQMLPEVSGDPIKQAIANASKYYGVPAGHALSIVAQESGFDPDTTMQSSSAKGLFQFLDADRKQYGVTADAPLNHQIDAGMRKIRDNYLVARAAVGREPTPGELYATYYQGIGAGPAILSNPDASFRETLNKFGKGHADRVITANPWLKGISTNREFVDWSEKKMREKGFVQESAKTPEQSTGDFIASFLSPAQKGTVPAAQPDGKRISEALAMGQASPAPARRVPPMPVPQFGVRPLISPKQTPAEAQSIRRAEAGDKRLETTLEQSTALAGSLENLRQTTALLDKVRTGFGADTITTAKRVLGVDVANEEQLQTLLGDQVMARVGQTKGAVSEKEMDLFQKYSANFGKTTEGNRKIVEFATKAAERAKVIASTIQQGFAAGKSPFQIEQEVSAIREANPIANALTPPPPAPGGIPLDEDEENAWLNSRPRPR